MDLGLETIKHETVDVSSEVIRIFEECGLADQMFVQEIAVEQKIHSVESILHDISLLPKEEKDIVIKFFSSDESMKQLIQASEEGQKIQDLLRWGPAGFLIGLYLGSFKRIKEVIAYGKGQWITDTRSQYLPMEKDAKETLNCCEEILNALKSGDSKRIVDVCNKHGAKIDLATSTDWAAAITSFLAAGTLFCIPIVGPGGAWIAGTIVGKYVSLKARMSVAEKGYTTQKLDMYANQVVKLIDMAQAMKTTSVEISADIKPVYDKLYKLTCSAISTIGRGICATIRENS